MIGAIIGDIVGSRFEFNNTSSKDFELSYPLCDYTDDTICTIAIADAILSGEDYGDSLHRWCRKYPNPKGAYGASFSRWLASDNPKPYNSFGNGAAMRVSPVAWAFPTLQTVLREAIATAMPTHNDPRGIIGAMTIAEAIFSIKGNVASSEIIEQITIRSYGKDYKNRLPARGVFDETCMGCVPLALYITNQSHDFEDALRNAISYGGDSDTIGAIVGSIAEARWGVPHWIEHEFMQYLPNEMINVVNQFKQKYK